MNPKSKQISVQIVLACKKKTNQSERRREHWDIHSLVHCAVFGNINRPGNPQDACVVISHDIEKPLHNKVMKNLQEAGNYV